MNALKPDQFSRRKDFLGCHERESVVSDLKRFGETSFGGDCMSDYVFVLDKKLQKKRMCLLITRDFLYVYDHRNWKLKFMNYLKYITTVSISAKNCALMAIHFGETGTDLVMESYRRIDLIVYAARAQKEAGLSLFKLKIRKNFKSKYSDDKKYQLAEEDSPLRDVEPKYQEKAKKDIESNFLQETIRNSKKSGFLKQVEKKMFGRTGFQEGFYVLGDLGLICYKQYGDRKASGFIPILGGSVKLLNKSVYSKENIFCLSFAEEETAFQAVSRKEMEEWVKKIKEIQEKCLTAKDTIKEMGRVL